MLKTDTPPVAAVGSTSRLRRGERAIATIPPSGEKKDTVSMGLFSAAGRSIECEQSCRIEGLIQVSCDAPDSADQNRLIRTG